MKFWDDIRQSVRHLVGGFLGLRQYEAGKVDRLTNDMKLAGVTEDADIINSMSTVRARVRTMEHSDAYTKKFIGLSRANIPGPRGFTLQSRVMEFDPVRKEWVEDVVANSKIEDGWRDWCRREYCAVTGDMSFREFTHLMAAHYKRDGEFLARRIVPAGKYGFQVQALEPDLLDEAYTATLSNGNRIIMGVEINRWRKIVAFHLRKEFDGKNASPWTYSNERQRIDARDIYFGFDRTRAFQTRGMSALATALLVLNDNRQWERSSLVNARHSAGRIGFLYDETDEQTTKLPGDETESDGTPVLKIEAGSLYDIGSKRFSGIEPKFPHEQHGPFVKSNLRRAAAGAEVSYYSLSNDYESTSYSSGRLSYGDERERWRMDQQYFIEVLLQPIFRDWLEMALTTQTVALPLTKFDKFNQPEFIGRTWDYVDPQKDAQADLLLMNAKLLSKKRWFAERGLDIEDEYRQMKADKDLEEKYGIKPDDVSSDRLMAAAAKGTKADDDDVDATKEAANRAIHELLKTEGNGHE